MLGMTFELMTQAQRDMAKFKLGDRVTLLLTADGRVAGVRSASEVESSNVGILEKADGGDVEVKLLSGLTIKSKASNTAAQQGQLVTVSSKDLFSVYVSPVTSSNVSGSLDVASGKVGTLSLSTSCRIYDQASGGQLVEVSLDDLAVSTVPNNKITYAYRNASGRIDVLVLNDVTGDGYTYGKVSYGDQDDVTVGVKVVLTNSEGTKSAVGAVTVPGTGWGGVAFSGDGTSAMATVPPEDESQCTPQRLYRTRRQDVCDSGRPGAAGLRQGPVLQQHHRPMAGGPGDGQSLCRAPDGLL